MSEILVRRARQEDGETIMEFNKAIALETEDKELVEEVVVEGTKAVFNNQDYGFYVVAENGQEIVGSLMITYEWSDWHNGIFWWVQGVYVKNEFRRQGIFKKLYGYVREKAYKAEDACGLRLYVEKDNIGARQVYEKLGMEKTGYRVYEELFEE